MGVRHYRELVAWQLSYELKREVFAFVARAPAKHDGDFCADIRRSARSAPANIAEGFGRETHRDFANFLSHARASLTETDQHLLDARDSDYLTDPDYQRLTALVRRALAATTRLQSYLLRTPNYRRPLDR